MYDFIKNISIILYFLFKKLYIFAGDIKNKLSHFSLYDL